MKGLYYYLLILFFKTKWARSSQSRARLTDLNPGSHHHLKLPPIVIQGSYYIPKHVEDREDDVQVQVHGDTVWFRNWASLIAFSYFTLLLIFGFSFPQALDQRDIAKLNDIDDDDQFSGIEIMEIYSPL